MLRQNGYSDNCRPAMIILLAKFAMRSMPAAVPITVSEHGFARFSLGIRRNMAGGHSTTDEVLIRTLHCVVLSTGDFTLRHADR